MNEDKSYYDSTDALHRDVSHIQFVVDRHTRQIDELSESIADLMAATAPVPQGDVLERIATALERLAAIGNCVAVFEDGERLMVQQVQS